MCVRGGAGSVVNPLKLYKFIYIFSIFWAESS
jgi:hypothetical protein